MSQSELDSYLASLRSINYTDGASTMISFGNPGGHTTPRDFKAIPKMFDFNARVSE